MKNEKPLTNKSSGADGLQNGILRYSRLEICAATTRPFDLLAWSAF